LLSFDHTLARVKLVTFESADTLLREAVSPNRQRDRETENQGEVGITSATEPGGGEGEGGLHKGHEAPSVGGWSSAFAVSAIDRRPCGVD
jgi:hypothetical protein